MLLFLLAVVIIIVAIYFALLPVYLHFSSSLVNTLEAFHSGKVVWWHPRLFLYTVVGTLVVLISGSIYMTHLLSSGGGAVATMLGGRLVSADSKDADEKKLLNVVEEMAIASGTPTPEVYILDSEAGINAFAAGYSTSDTAIGVTRGAVKVLTRDELQGVIAHEFSHILNGDMRLNIRLTGVLHGILSIATIGYWLLYSSGSGSGRSRGRGGGSAYIVVLSLLLIIIGYVGVFFGKLIKSAVSRAREFLADASAVQFTRNPNGIAGALKKIAGYETQSRMESPHAETMSHMFFSNALRSSFFEMMSTHPPLQERISRLDPSFKKSREAFDQWVLPTSPTQIPYMMQATAYTDADRIMPLQPAQVTEQVGNPGVEHLNFAHGFLANLPETLFAAAHNAFAARALMYGLLLDEDKVVRQQQLAILKESADPLVYSETERLLMDLGKIGAHCRLPLIDLALPALRELSKPQYERFHDNIHSLIQADKRLSLFEFVFLKILTHHMQVCFGKVDRQSVRYRSLKPILADVVLALSTLALGGHQELADAEQAFGQGIQRLTRKRISLLSAAQIDLKALDRAFNRLAHASPSLKREILEAAVVTVASDGRVTVKEAELLRAFGDALGCPIPPFLPAA